MKRWMLASLVAVAWSSAALAHAAGQPFVIINQQYVNSNSLAGLDPSWPQDLGPQSYPADQPIHIAVDRNVFGSPDYQFKWRDDSDGDLGSGDSIAHKFSVRSHIVTLAMQTAADQGFQDVDTIGLDVVPKAGYKAPTGKIKISQVAKAGGYDLAFTVTTQLDGSAKLKRADWKFGDGGTGSGTKITHKFEGNDFRLFPTLTLEDNNGLVATLGFELDGGAKSVSVTDLAGQTGVASLAAFGVKSTGLRWFGIGLVVLGVVVMAVALIKKLGPGKRTQKKTAVKPKT